MKKTIHVIFKTHLDIGFTNTAAAVIDNYFENYIPSALKLSQKTREKNDGKNRFIWTTGSWLIEEFLERGNSTMRNKMEQAIEAGDIAWHALPFTTHSELMDQSLFKAGISISRRLDKRFGKTTIAAKMTDVPGHCRGIIPILADEGVEFLHIGVNPASKTIKLPPIFNWKAPCGSQIMVNYVSGYGMPLEIEGLDDSMIFAHSGDNCGPPTENQLEAGFKELRQTYKDARITGSTLDNFAIELRSISNSLPIITGEMGDTWIHGVGSDPFKVAQFRQLCRLRREWKESGRYTQEPGFEQFTKKLLLIPEHTWGMDEKTHLKDYSNYNREDFLRARNRNEVPSEVISEGNEKFCAFKLNENDHSSERDEKSLPTYKKFETSWKEQRQYITDSLQYLQTDIFKKEAQKALEEIKPEPLTENKLIKEGFAQFDPKPDFKCGGFKISLSERTGALVSLIDNKTGRSWCTEGESLSLIGYETFSSDSYRDFHNKYNINKEWTEGWAIPDFTKPGLSKVKALQHRFYEPEKAGFFIRNRKEGGTGICEIAALMTMPKECTDLYGAPEYVQILYSFSDSNEMDIELRWSSKNASRIPEALWFSFVPDIVQSGKWSIEKMGEEISPFEVIDGGNRALHCTNKGITYTDGKESLRIEPLDTPLVSPGRPRILEFDQSQPDLKEGVHFNIYNNLWGTNFPMWYEDDGLARFRLHFN